jgi:3-hydroxyisobutyrate dehydrogenase-like beta-hydroxyacid dehydrogenase
MRVGWIGLGSVGLPSAIRIAAAGHRVVACDLEPPRPEDAPGVILTGSPAQAAADCDVLCLMVFSDDQVEALLLGDGGLFSHLAEGVPVAIFTTGTIAAVKALAAAAPPGVPVLDACFSRRQEQAVPGEYMLMVGGDAAAVERARPVLQAFAPHIHHMGPVGSGRAVKLVNNLLWVANNQLTVDAMRFAEGLGLDPQAALAVILKASGAADTQNVFLNRAWPDVFAGMTRYMTKDAAAAVRTAREAGVDLGALGAAVAAYVEPPGG